MLADPTARIDLPTLSLTFHARCHIRAVGSVISVTTSHKDLLGQNEEPGNGPRGTMTGIQYLYKAMHRGGVPTTTLGGCTYVQ